MPSLSEILSTVQQGVIAANNLVVQTRGSLLNISSQLTTLNSPTLPTIQTLTAGTSATYTLPSSAVKWIEVFMVGAGGGGCGVSNGSSASIAGSSGGATLFSSWSANGGSQCTGTATAQLPTYGNGGTAGTGTATRRIPGQNGAAAAINNVAYTWGYWGGDSELGRGAGVTKAVQPQGGQAAAANSGGGGSGSFAGAAAFVQGGGGGGGEFVYLLITNPSSFYLYTIGPKGAGGVGTTVAGGDGGTGVIYVIEHYGA